MKTPDTLCFAGARIRGRIEVNMRRVIRAPLFGNGPLFDWAETRHRPATSLAARRLSRTHRLRPTVARVVAELAGFNHGEVRA